MIDFAYNFACTFFQKNFPGCDLENIAFPIFSKRKSLLFSLFISVFKYSIAKIHKSANPEIQIKLNKMQSLFKIINLLFFLNFLRKNTAINFTHWLFGIIYKPLNPNNRRFLDNEYLNRTIVWNYFIQGFLTILPMLQRTMFPSLIKKLYLYSSYIGPFMASSNFDDDEFLKCAVCNDNKPANIVENKGLLYKLWTCVLFLLL